MKYDTSENPVEVASETNNEDCNKSVETERKNEDHIVEAWFLYSIFKTLKLFMIALIFAFFIAHLSEFL